MRIAVFGSKDWESYPDVMRSLTVVIQDAHDKGDNEVVFVQAGNRGAENMVTEYVGKTEKFLRQKSFRLKEEVVRGRDHSFAKDMGIIESSPDMALVFSTDCKRTKACARILKEYEIPTTIIR